MHVYRIVLEKYAGSLVASGLPNRWNSRNVPMIYTARSRALAVLENLVHRSGEGLRQYFRSLVIELPVKRIPAIDMDGFPEKWHERAHQQFTQQLGDAFIQDGRLLAVRVPSAIVGGEWNVLINPEHAGFDKVKFTVEPFAFDPRL